MNKKVIKTTNLSHSAKIRIYKTDPALHKKSMSFEKKILQTVYVTTLEEGIWRRKYNRKIKELFGAANQ